MDVNIFCLKLVHCEKEVEVIELLKEYGLWNDKTAWQNYGDNENNFAIVGNQQSRPEAAVVEKINHGISAHGRGEK